MSNSRRLVKGEPDETLRSRYLVEMFVEQILNRHDRAVVDVLFAPTFQDFDPAGLPGYPGKGVQGVEYVKNLCTFLSSEAIDFSFTLEEAFGDPDRIAYQLFGEGTIATDLEAESNRGSRDVGIVGVSGSGTRRRTSTFVSMSPDQQTMLAKTGRLIGGRLHVEYHSVGIFKIKNGRFTQRRGHIILK